MQSKFPGSPSPLHGGAMSRRSFLADATSALAAAAAALALPPAAQALMPLQSAAGAADVTNILYGLALRASGGGGGFTVGQALVKAILTDIPPSQYVFTRPEAALDSDFAVMAGGIGAPSALTPEKIRDFALYAREAIQQYQKDTGIRVTALVPVEAGPVNALLAMYLGWSTGLKVFDCDGAGRAVPSLTNLVYAYNAYRIAPVYLAGNIGGVIQAKRVTPDPGDAASAESAIRPLLSQFNNAAGLVCWGQTGAQLRNSSYLLSGTMAKAEALGQLWQSLANLPEADIVRALGANPAVLSVISGKLTGIQQGPLPGYDDLLLTFEDHSGRLYRAHALNENLMLQDAATSQVIATAPSSISMVFNVQGRGTWIPLNNGDDLQHAGVLSNGVIVMVLRQHCTLFDSTSLAPSFLNVLRQPPFSYSGPITPLDCDRLSMTCAL